VTHSRIERRRPGREASLVSHVRAALKASHKIIFRTARPQNSNFSAKHDYRKYEYFEDQPNTTTLYLHLLSTWYQAFAWPENKIPSELPRQKCLKLQSRISHRATYLRTYSWQFDSRQDWADDEDLDDTTNDLPPPTTTTNKDGTKTFVSYRFNEGV